MKKLVAWLLLSVLLLSCMLTACTNDQDEYSGEGNDIEADEIFGDILAPDSLDTVAELAEESTSAN